MLEIAANEQFCDSHDLDPSLFRRLVTRRMRQLSGELTPLVQCEDERRDMESTLEKIHRTVDFLPVSFLQKGTERAKAVCRIVTQRSLGTGFLVANGFVMTNNHVIEDRATASGTRAEFGFDGNQTPVTVQLRPDRFFITDETLDFTIVACDMTGLSDVTPIALKRNPATVSRRERVNVIQHPRGRAKEVAIHDNRVERIRDTVIKYRTDTEPGSSGSPVFNNDWELVALHHAGVRQGASAENEGVRISAIVQRLMRGSRGRNESSRELEDLMQTVTDVSPYFGFFDRLGIVDDEDLEVEVPNFGGTSQFADVGFWNIEHFNNSVSDDRVSRVADVVASLALNAIGLTEVQEGALQRLQAQLVRHGFDYGFELLNVRGAQDIAVLFDRDTTTVKSRGDIARRHKKKLKAKTTTGRTVFPRAPLFVECTVDEGQGAAAKFLMIVVHLKAFGDAASKQRRRLAAEALAAIIEDVREREELPVVLGGDFNETLNNDVLAALTGSPDLISLTADDAVSGALSFVGDRHRSLIDHIITTKDVSTGDISGDDAAIVRLDQSIRDFADDVSDHVPVVVRIVYRDAPVAVDPDTNGAITTIEIPDGVDRLRFVREGDESLITADS